MRGRAKAEGRLESKALVEANRQRLTDNRHALETERATHLEAVVALGFDAEQHARAREAAQTAQTEQHNAALSQQAAQNELVRLHEHLAREQQALSDHDRITLEIERIITERSQHALARETIERFKIKLIGRVRPALSLKLSALLADASGGAYSQAELNEDYDIMVHSGGQSHALKRYSGGEEAMANLCLRLAISELINESAGQQETFLVLDEVLGAQDDERRENILEMLQALSGRFSQILMVNHINAVSDALPNAMALEFDELSRTSRAFYVPPSGVSLPD